MHGCQRILFVATFLIGELSFLIFSVVKNNGGTDVSGRGVSQQAEKVHNNQLTPQCRHRFN